MNLEKLVRNVYPNLTPYTCGLADLPVEEIKELLGKEQVFKLSFNENPLGPSRNAIKAMGHALKHLNLYPSSSGDALRQEIAKREMVTKEQVILSNGADDLIALLAQTFLEEEDEVIIPELTFPQYTASANIMGAKPLLVPMKSDFSIDLDAILENITDKTKLIFLCNPNNPTGKILKRVELERFIEKVPDHVLVVIDEAYYEYVDSTDFGTAVDLVKHGHQVFVIRTFSKMYALAATRIGYGIGDPAIIEAINRVRPPFNVNGIAQAGALECLKDIEYQNKSKILISNVKNMMYMAFDQLGVTYVESEANFILIDTKINNLEMFRHFVNHGIIVRTLPDPRLSTYLRISLGTASDMLHFIDAFKLIKQNYVEEKVL